VHAAACDAIEYFVNNSVSTALAYSTADHTHGTGTSVVASDGQKLTKKFN